MWNTIYLIFNPLYHKFLYVETVSPSFITVEHIFVPMMSLEIFVDMNLPAALRPW